MRATKNGTTGPTKMLAGSLRSLMTAQMKARILR